MSAGQQAFCPPYEEQATLSFLGRRVLVTDLSHVITPEDPTFVGHQRTLMWDHLSHEETIRLGLTRAPYSYRVVGFTMCDHSSTHVDAINHVVPEPGARSVDQLPLAWSMAPAVWLDLAHKEPNAYITAADVDRALDRAGVAVQPDSVVLYHTGWYRKYRDRFAYIRDYPGLDRGAVEHLNDLGAIAIGADAPSIDAWIEVSTVKVQPAHMVCRERRILNLENLANVDRIPGHAFWFVGLPLKLGGATGSPIRAVALVDLGT
ncbi:MAG TPA: cyclase family protein [Chloroflexota bacterium]|jgi:kynurenine formamidase|nr:cyclase family protein [Chloroflexota bacterium]